MLQNSSPISSQSSLVGGAVKEFIQAVLIEDVEQRPDAMQCVRLLTKLLYGIPVEGVARRSELDRLCRDTFMNTVDVANDASVLRECLYMAISELI